MHPLFRKVEHCCCYHVLGPNFFINWGIVTWLSLVIKWWPIGPIDPWPYAAKMGEGGGGSPRFRRAPCWCWWWKGTFLSREKGHLLAKRALFSTITDLRFFPRLGTALDLYRTHLCTRTSGTREGGGGGSRRNRVNHFFFGGGGGSFYLKFAHLLSNF